MLIWVFSQALCAILGGFRYWLQSCNFSAKLWDSCVQRQTRASLQFILQVKKIVMSLKLSPELWWRVWINEYSHVVTRCLAVPAPDLDERIGVGNGEGAHALQSGFQCYIVLVEFWSPDHLSVTISEFYWLYFQILVIVTLVVHGSKVNFLKFMTARLISLIL